MSVHDITDAAIDCAIRPYSDYAHNRYVDLMRRLIDRKLDESEKQAYEAIQRCKELVRLGENVEAELKDMEALGAALFLAVKCIRKDQQKPE